MGCKRLSHIRNDVHFDCAAQWGQRMCVVIVLAMEVGVGRDVRDRCDGRNMFNVISVWGNSWHHSAIGKLLSTPNKFEMK